MPLVRQQRQDRSKPEREPHHCEPVPGEPGRYYVKSRSAAKKGEDESYTVDIFEKEETNGGTVTGTCPCKGWSVRKDCSHLTDARAAYVLAEAPF